MVLAVLNGCKLTPYWYLQPLRAMGVTSESTVGTFTEKKDNWTLRDQISSLKSQLCSTCQVLRPLTLRNLRNVSLNTRKNTTQAQEIIKQDLLDRNENMAACFRLVSVFLQLLKNLCKNHTHAIPATLFMTNCPETTTKQRDEPPQRWAAAFHFQDPALPLAPRDVLDALEPLWWSLTRFRST